MPCGPLQRAARPGGYQVQFDQSRDRQPHPHDHAGRRDRTELERRSLVKGYEFRKGKYLLLSDDDLDSVKVDSSSVMTIEKFVDTASIDPVYYDAAYFLVPDGEAGKDVYAVLREAIAKTGKTALSRVVIAQRERTIALRPMGEGLMAHTLYEDRDLNSSQELFEDLAAIKTDPEMVQLATQLVQRQSGSTTQPISRTATRPGSGR